MDITIPPGETATIWLPGATALRIDAGHRVIAVDLVSTMTCGNGDFAASTATASAPLMPDWLVADLREGCYGDFHQLKPAAECFDSTCAGQGGEHATAEDRARLRDYPEDDGSVVAACGHEYALGGIAYACQRPPHETGSYRPEYRHAAEIDGSQAEGTDAGDGDGPATLVTRGEDEAGDGQDWRAERGAVADLDSTAREQ